MIDAAHDAWSTDGVLPRRFAAWLVDAILLAIGTVVLHLALLALGLLTFGLGLPLLGLLPLVPLVYVLGFLASAGGRTPGQAAAGLVLRRDDDLGRPTGGQALVWTVGLALTLLAGAVWMAVALITVRHRALHDLASGLTMTRADAVAPRTGIWTVPAGRSGRPFA